MAVNGDDDTDVEPAWHERPSTLAGASIGALLVLGLLFLGVSCVSQQFDDPDPTPQYYLDPSTSGSSAPSTSSTSTTETITSTSPPVTTDIDPGNTSSTTTTSSSTDTTTSFNPSNLPRTREPSTYDDGRTRPRFNETRTLYPRP